MTSRLRRAFIDNLKSADWMDYETRQSADEKVQIGQNIIDQIRSRLIIELVRYIEGTGRLCREFKLSCTR